MSASADDVKAADWFAQARGGQLDAADEQAWLKWIEETSHQQAYENCALAWSFG